MRKKVGLLLGCLVLPGVAVLLMFSVFASGAAAVTVPAQTKTGFYYPTGVPEPYNYVGWFAGAPVPGYPPYNEGRYHLGQDIRAKEGDPVFAIADGVVTHVSYNNWGEGSIGVVLKHKLNTGEEFLAIYGHVVSNVRIGEEIKAGAVFARIGPYYDFPHLHFGIRPGTTMPPRHWGSLPVSFWPDTNGMVEPIEWITTKTPYGKPSAVKIDARIDGWSAGPREVQVGDTVTLRLDFTNMGNVTHRFIAGAGLWRPDRQRVDFGRAVTLEPGASTTVSWTHTINQPGSWDVVFTVWKQEPYTMDNLLARAPAGGPVAYINAYPQVKPPVAAPSAPSEPKPVPDPVAKPPVLPPSTPSAPATPPVSPAPPVTGGGQGVPPQANPAPVPPAAPPASGGTGGGAPDQNPVNTPPSPPAAAPESRPARLEQTIPPGTGASVVFDEGRLQLTVPAGTAAKTVAVSRAASADERLPVTPGARLLSDIYDLAVEQNGQPLARLDRPLQLELTFDPAALQGARAEQVHMLYWDQTVQRWLALPTSADMQTGRATVTTNRLDKMVLVHDTAFPVFTDMTTHWARAEVLKMASLGVARGYPGETFQPNRPVTRAELAAMLTTGLDLASAPVDKLPFRDEVPAWAKSSVRAVVDAGLFAGYPDGTFRPHAQITRQEMAVVLARAAGLEVKPEAVPLFMDARQIPAWARGSIAAVHNSGIAGGFPDGTFRPGAPITRGESSVLLWRLLELSVR